jgi:hypothetical protein
MDDRTTKPARRDAAVQEDDLSTLGVAITALSLVFIVALFSCLLWFTLGRSEKRSIAAAHAQLRPQAEGSTWIAERKRTDPLEAPFPLLQTDPDEDLRRFRAHEDSLLNGYGWSDREKGKVRIPVARAMELAAERGLTVHVPRKIPGPAKEGMKAWDPGTP